MPPCPFISNGFLRGIFDGKVTNSVFLSKKCRNSKLTVLKPGFLGWSNEALMMIIEIFPVTNQPLEK